MLGKDKHNDTIIVFTFFCDVIVISFVQTIPPNISIEKFCQSAKRIIGVSSAAVVRDVFATTVSFKQMYGTA